MMTGYSRKSNASALFVMAFLIALLPGTLLAQQAVEPPVDVEVAISHIAVPAGDNVELVALFHVPDDHHITDKNFGIFYIEPNLPEGITLAETVWPEGEIENNEEVYRGDVKLTLKLNVSNSAAINDYTIDYEYSYQICRELDPEMCFLPNGGSGNFALSVLESGSKAQLNQHHFFTERERAESEVVSAEGGKLEDKLTRALEEKSFFAFVLVFIAGILISFTPCVYPMIPIIIGFVGGSAGGSRVKGFFLSVFFVLGLVITYSILGVAAGATGALFGAFMSNPIVLWFIVAVFIALGASMMGAFDLTIPAGLQGAMMSGERKGVVGAIIIGAVTGIVAAPCAGPPLLVLLSWIGNTGNLFLGFLYMATFALGLGVLFIIIGTFAGAMTALPQAGTWMVKIKKGLGIVIFAVTLYYLSILVSENIYHIILGGFFLFVGLYIGATAKWDELNGAGKAGKGLGILLLVAGIFYFVLALADINKVSLRGGAGNATTVAATGEQNHVLWNINVHDEIVAQAKAEGKPILVDFYADWCGVCVELDHKVWNQEIVIDAAKDYLLLKLDFTKAKPEIEALRQEYGVGGLPTVMILGPDGKERARFTSFKSPEETVQWLEQYSE